jgi:hypothetical protein
LGGDFTSFDSTSVGRIARAGTSGLIDTTFSSGAGANAAIEVIAVDADGEMIVGGYFTT